MEINQVREKKNAQAFEENTFSNKYVLLDGLARSIVLWL